MVGWLYAQTISWGDGDLILKMLGFGFIPAKIYFGGRILK